MMDMTRLSLVRLLVAAYYVVMHRLVENRAPASIKPRINHETIAKNVLTFLRIVTNSSRLP